MDKDLRSFWGPKNLFVIFFAIVVLALHSCGGSGGGGGAGGNGSGTTPTVITWAKTYGESDDEAAYAIQSTADGGYIIAGNSNNEILVIKIDAYGNIVWQYTQAGMAKSIISSGDGGYLIAGQLLPVPIGDIGIVKLNSNGQREWEQTYNKYGGIANEIKQTSDSGYVIVGEFSNNVYVIKTDNNGNSIWEKSFPAGEKGIGYSILQTSDGYIIAGEGTLTGRTDSDIWIFKIDSAGNNIIWQKTFGGAGYDSSYSIRLTSDGGIIAAGKKSSSAGDADFWMAKLKSNGALEWEKTYGSSCDEIAYSIQQTSDGGFIVAGEAKTSAGDTDFLILKLDANGGLLWEKTYGASGNDIARSIQQTNDGGYIVAGETTSGAGDTDFWVLKLDANGNLN